MRFLARCDVAIHGPARHEINLERVCNDRILVWPLSLGGREELRELQQFVKDRFECEMGPLISLHPEDAKHGKFLKNEIGVNGAGWYHETNPNYAKKLLKMLKVPN